MNPLLEKRRKARQSNVPACGHIFTITRPTDADMLRVSGMDDIQAIVRFVVGWDASMTEAALSIPGGSDAPVAFDPDLFEDWLADHPQAWPVLSKAILDAYKSHRAAVEDAEKN